MKKNTWFFEEQGLSLIETLISVVILGLCFLMIFNSTVLNSKMIESNSEMQSAIAARDDVKEWLTYRSQSSLVSQLNQIVFTGSISDSVVPEDEEVLFKERISHLILDNTGIQRDTEGKIVFREQENDFQNLKVREIVKYSNDYLPTNLKNRDESPYFACYIDEKGKLSDFLILVTIEGEDDKKVKENATPVVLSVFSRLSGKKLTETVMNWISEY